MIVSAFSLSFLSRVSNLCRNFFGKRWNISYVGVLQGTLIMGQFHTTLPFISSRMSLGPFHKGATKDLVVDGLFRGLFLLFCIWFLLKLSSYLLTIAVLHSISTRVSRTRKIPRPFLKLNKRIKTETRALLTRSCSIINNPTALFLWYIYIYIYIYTIIQLKRFIT